MTVSCPACSACLHFGFVFAVLGRGSSALCPVGKCLNRVKEVPKGASTWNPPEEGGGSCPRIAFEDSQEEACSDLLSRSKGTRIQELESEPCDSPLRRWKLVASVTVQPPYSQRPGPDSSLTGSSRTEERGAWRGINQLGWGRHHNGKELSPEAAVSSKVQFFLYYFIYFW